MTKNCLPMAGTALVQTSSMGLSTTFEFEGTLANDGGR